jgi:hypothetical protein
MKTVQFESQTIVTATCVFSEDHDHQLVLKVEAALRVLVCSAGYQFTGAAFRMQAERRAP